MQWPYIKYRSCYITYYLNNCRLLILESVQTCLNCPDRVAGETRRLRHNAICVKATKAYHRPYSRRGHDGQKERLGWQMYRKFARQYVNSIVTSRSRDVTSLFRQLPYDVLFKKTRHCFSI